MIGFMTLRQFLYLVIFVPFGLVAWKLFPIPVINILLGMVVTGVGLAFAFIPVNDRPLEVWVRNFIKRLNSPTQFVYQKSNPPLAFLDQLYFTDNPHRIVSHVETQAKLTAYLNSKKSKNTTLAGRQSIHQLVMQPSQQLRPAPAPTAKGMPQPSFVSQPSPAPAPGGTLGSRGKQPYLSGAVKNSRQIPLPGILIYVKDQSNNVVRLLKTNPHGIFATYSPVSGGEYNFEIKDPNGLYFFDKIKMKLNGGDDDHKPLEFYSKELI